MMLSKSLLSGGASLELHWLMPVMPLILLRPDILDMPETMEASSGKSKPSSAYSSSILSKRSSRSESASVRCSADEDME